MTAFLIPQSDGLAVLSIGLDDNSDAAAIGFRYDKAVFLEKMADLDSVTVGFDGSRKRARGLDPGTADTQLAFGQLEVQLRERALLQWWKGGSQRIVLVIDTGNEGDIACRIGGYQVNIVLAATIQQTTDVLCPDARHDAWQATFRYMADTFHRYRGCPI